MQVPLYHTKMLQSSDIDHPAKGWNYKEVETYKMGTNRGKLNDKNLNVVSKWSIFGPFSPKVTDCCIDRFNLVRFSNFIIWQPIEPIHGELSWLTSFTKVQYWSLKLALWLAQIRLWSWKIQTTGWRKYKKGIVNTVLIRRVKVMLVTAWLLMLVTWQTVTNIDVTKMKLLLKTKNTMKFIWNLDCSLAPPSG